MMKASNFSRRCLNLCLVLCLLTVLVLALGITVGAEASDSQASLELTVVNGETVLLEDGVKVTEFGWYDVNGVAVYVRYSDKKAIVEDYVIGGKQYVWTEDQGLILADGVVAVNGTMGLYKDGQVVTAYGWHTVNGVSVYVTYSDKKLIAEDYVIGGKQYAWTEDKGLVLANGLVTVNGKLGLYENGKTVTVFGWHNVDGVSVYVTYSDKKLIAEDYVIGGKQYVWTEDKGLVAADGLVTVNGKLGLYEDGKTVTVYGWHDVDGVSVYVTYSDKKLIAEDYVIGGKQYVWTEDKGLVAADGLVTVNGKLGYYKEGKAVTAYGWYNVDGVTVYVSWSANNASGKLIAEDHVIGGKPYMWVEGLGLVPYHAHEEVIDPAKEATCTETGLTEGKHCAICNAVFVAQEVVPAKGHVGEIVPAVAATCTEKGKTQGEQCSVCGTWIKKQTTVKALGHVGVWTVNTAPTATTEGKATCTCTTCGEVAQELTLACLTSANVFDPTAGTSGMYNATVLQAGSCTKAAVVKYTVLPVQMNYAGTLEFTAEAAPEGHDAGAWAPSDANLVANKGGVVALRCTKCGEVVNAGTTYAYDGGVLGANTTSTAPVYLASGTYLVNASSAYIGIEFPVAGTYTYEFIYLNDADKVVFGSRVGTIYTPAGNVGIGVNLSATLTEYMSVETVDGKSVSGSTFAMGNKKLLSYSVNIDEDKAGGRMFLYPNGTGCTSGYYLLKITAVEAVEPEENRTLVIGDNKVNIKEADTFEGNEYDLTIAETGYYTVSAPAWVDVTYSKDGGSSWTDLIHADVNASNVLVKLEAGDYLFAFQGTETGKVVVTLEVSSIPVISLTESPTIDLPARAEDGSDAYVEILIGEDVKPGIYTVTLSGPRAMMGRIYCLAEHYDLLGNYVEGGNGAGSWPGNDLLFANNNFVSNEMVLTAGETLRIRQYMGTTNAYNITVTLTLIEEIEEKILEIGENEVTIKEAYSFEGNQYELNVEEEGYYSIAVPAWVDVAYSADNGENWEDLVIADSAATSKLVKLKAGKHLFEFQATEAGKVSVKLAASSLPVISLTESPAITLTPSGNVDILIVDIEEGTYTVTLKGPLRLLGRMYVLAEHYDSEGNYIEGGNGTGTWPGNDLMFANNNFVSNVMTLKAGDMLRVHQYSGMTTTSGLTLVLTKVEPEAEEEV